MSKIINVYRNSVNKFGKVFISYKTPNDFAHLLNVKLTDVILFDDGTQEKLDNGLIILPRYYFIFVGNKDGELQYKSYEYNQYRIVVSTYKGIIVSIDSIG